MAQSLTHLCLPLFTVQHQETPPPAPLILPPMASVSLGQLVPGVNHWVGDPFDKRFLACQWLSISSPKMTQIAPP